MVGSSGRENNMGLDSIIQRRLSLFYKPLIERGKYHRIKKRVDEFLKERWYETPNFDKHMRENLSEILNGDAYLTPYYIPYIATAAVVYELYRRDPTYFDFVKPGNVADVAVETFDYLLNQGKAREVYRRLEEFLEKPLSQVPEFQKLVEFIDKYGFTPYKEGIGKYDPDLWKKLIDGNGGIIEDGFAVYTELNNGGKRDRYEYQRLRDKIQEELLPAFAKVIAKKTEEYLKKLGY